jgi:hypothetical protein
VVDNAAVAIPLPDLSLSCCLVAHKTADEDDDIHAQVLILAGGDLGRMVSAQRVLKVGGPDDVAGQEAERMEYGVGRKLQRSAQEEVVSRSLENFAIVQEVGLLGGDASGPVVQGPS